MIKQKYLKTASAMLRRHKFMVAAGVLLVALLGGGIGVSVRQASTAAKRNRLTLEQLAKEQHSRAEQLAAQHPLTPQLQDDTSNLQFKDISDAYKRPTCTRLENRPGIVITSSTCHYNLRAFGRLTMAIVLVYEGGPPEHSQLVSGDKNNPYAMAYINTYLQAQAKRYKVTQPPYIDLKFYGPYSAAAPVLGMYYRERAAEILNVFNETSKRNAVPEEAYDMIHFVLLDSTYGGAAFPWLHRAFTYNSSGAVVPTFVHETLHLLGASDKYNNNDCSTIGTNDPFGRYNGTLPGQDIMCSNFSLSASAINDITAREIGWGN